MQLLNPKKIGLEKKNQAGEERVARLKLQIKETEEKKKLSELYDDWEPLKRKKFEEYCRWNQEMQGRKATLLIEIEELEHKRDVLQENLKAYLD